MAGQSPYTETKYINVETFRRDGRGVRTPVWFVERAGELCFSTPSQTAKVKRLRHTARVRVAPCDRAGQVSGDWVEGQARLLEGEEAEQVDALLARRYGWSRRLLDLFGRLRGWRYTLVAIRPAPAAAAVDLAQPTADS